MAGIEYEIKPTLPLTAPKGKLPYIEDDDTKLGDSQFIIQHLKTNYNNLDEGLNKAELALSLAMQRLLEEHLYWVSMYSRWLYTDTNWQINKKAIFGVMPPVIRDIVAAYFRNKIKKQIYGHGIGRHDAEEIFKLGMLDIDALSSCLSDKKYFLGEQPTTLDASAFGILISTIGCPIESPLKEYGLSKDNLTNFVAHIKTHFFSDL
jgi:glutathione S-transferase